MQEPATIKQLRQVLGLINYQRKCICIATSILAPLTANLQGKVQNAQRITLFPQAKQAFVSIKQTLANAALLAHPADNATLSLHTYAPALYLEPYWNKLSRDSGLTEVFVTFPKPLQMLNVVTLRMILNDSECTLQQDILNTCSLISLHRQEISCQQFSKPSDNHTSKQVRHLSCLSQFDCTLRHLPDVDNAAAHCLSRVVSSVYHIFPLETMPVTLQEIAGLNHKSHE